MKEFWKDVDAFVNKWPLCAMLMSGFMTAICLGDALQPGSSTVYVWYNAFTGAFFFVMAIYYYFKRQKQKAENERISPES